MMMKFFSFTLPFLILILHDVSSEGLRAVGSLQAEKNDEREAPWGFNMCQFFIGRWFNTEDMMCGCNFDFLRQSMSFQCDGRLCIGGEELGTCVEPKLDASVSLRTGIQTNVCTKSLSNFTLDRSDQGKGIETFNVPEFCMDVQSAGFALAGCTANLGDHQCGCSICPSGFDIAVDCSGSADLPESVKADANFGCVGVTSVLTYFDANSVGGASAFPVNPIFLLAGGNTTMTMTPP